MPQINPTRGRPASTTREEVARIALDLFARQGFDETTIDDIARAVGVGRRTLFRYFSSKNDTVWGDFELVCERLRAELAARPTDEPLMTTLRHAVVASNTYPDDQLPDLRIRMTLITTVSALQAHSMLRYEAWRRVIADFAAHRLAQHPDDHLPQTIAHAALGTSMAAFVVWVDDPSRDLAATIDAGYRALAGGFSTSSSR
ncbi:mycofactocin system transcriptional regulator [Capillimicrobium parvum]|uniref:Mycofactocin biosynthesis transcriptional regulator MftR n=1 Tax=Capillimicrobium parvum TaxID=2884022 RepID=A0A9E6XVU3_9ACTN|nr:mycofactocin system transcriptional regulator [Capillimicrobium parvum]UGS35329.1 Putative mycofactocin biosynthesis transcriptional regulator MftR [Capillimicrobium parvum]